MNKILGLKTIKADRTSYKGFKYPNVGEYVEAPDWDPDPNIRCGNGLHFLKDGKGDGNYLDWSRNAIWLVLEVEPANAVISLNGDKWRCKRAKIVYDGDKDGALNYLVNHGVEPSGMVGTIMSVGYHGIATAGDNGTATVGDRGTATAGYNGIATAGDYGTTTAGYNGTATAGDYGTTTAGDHGTATAGEYGIATAGYNGTATAGDNGTAITGDGGTATAGYNGIATAGDNGTAIAGYNGTATAGDHGTATVGNYGTATAGYNSTATTGDRGTAIVGDRGIAIAGYNGIISIKYWDNNDNRYRFKIGYIGENGLKPNVKYKLNDKHEFVKVGKDE